MLCTKLSRCEEAALEMTQALERGILNSARRGGGAAAGAHSSNRSAGSKGAARWSLSGALVCLAIHLGNRLETSGLQVTI